jgi:peptidoglycan/LPS O-acetylase OafA/YrhL
MKYRKEIDGLRAFAIIPVIFFHAGLQSFSGGFVGVDVFFVVSGYLIATLILSELARNEFKISNFYLRRVRRILPALFLMILACLPLAWMFMLPSDMKEFSQSMVSVVLFLSNILFWLKSGYFDSSAELKPLIHTWSLSIEEQFYILFPIICLIIFKFSKRNIFLIFGFLVFFGVWAAQLIITKYPAMAFYFLPTRGWEIICGALIAFILLKRNAAFLKSVLVNQVLSLIGFSLILYSILVFNEFTPYPSFHTIIPVLGSALLIVFTRENTLVFKVFTNKLIAYIGLLSYSLYLWHQPIFAFTKYILVDSLSILLVFILTFISMAFAYLSYHIIEKPFRNKDKTSSKFLILTIGFAAILIIISGLAGHQTNGFIDRNPPNHLSNKFYYDLEMAPHSPGIYGRGCVSNSAEFCIVNEAKSESILMIGDSHSGDFLHAFKKFVEDRNLNAMQLTMGGCSFSPHSFNHNNGQCGEAAKLLKKTIEKKQVSTIIFVNNFYQHLESLNEIDAKENLLFISQLFKSALKNNIQILYFSPRPTLTKPLGRSAMANKLTQVKLREDKYKDLVESHIENFLVPLGLKNYNQRAVILDAFCAHSSICTNGMHGGRPLYRDQNHLSGYGANLIFKDFIKNFYANK